MAIIRTGIDMVEIARLKSQRPAIRARFLQRVFTRHELAEGGDSDALLAGRFAVKEAVSKALGSGIGWVRWQDIEVRRGPFGAPELHLYGNAKKLAETLGLDHWSISITDTDTHAAAVAVAFGLHAQPPPSIEI
ncbi:MAG TPA: holo-ACP synthase [Levilinea sp.]|nr:holo-ACP synthase [Levilinea sp.]